MRVFHFFCHTFKRMTRDARLYEELHDAISIRPLAKAMAQIEAPVDFSGLVWF
jgi:hypothetical protein